MGKKILHGLLVIVFIAIIIFFLFLPFFFDAIFNKGTFCDFFLLTDNIGDAVTYYGGVLTFTATMILGIMTYRQTQIAQKKSDESSEQANKIDELRLKMQNCVSA